MKAQFRSQCVKCGGLITPGTEIEYKRGAGSWHTVCPEKQAEAPVPEGAVELYRGYTYRPADMKGRILWDEKRAAWFVVLGQHSRYIREDGMSFGLSSDSGYSVTLSCRPATEAEVKPLEEAKAQQLSAILALAAAEKRLREVKDAILRDGDRPDLKVRPVGETLELEDRYDADAFVLAEDGIWFIRYNGRDGDCWAWNNLGGSSIAARCWPFPDVATEVRDLHRTVREQRALLERAKAAIAGAKVNADAA
jgi:hypothetical protein